MSKNRNFIHLNEGLHKFLHEQDIFGYRIPLNFNGHSSFHYTSTGGIFSVIIKICYNLYFLSLIVKMLRREDYNTYTFDFEQTEDRPSQNFSDMGLQVYHSLYHIDNDGYSQPLSINEETEKYINVQYI